ncbi:MAG: hypothetical protein JF628_07355 [Sphingomonas sp.]|jgi:hypothetical protein|nr:hypothetical protein [Sphingomonas sp.]
MSGGFNPINLASQVALGVATGGTSIFAQLATHLVSAIGQQVIQQVGEKLGLPPAIIDLAQGAFAAEVGDFSGVQQNVHEAADNFSGALGASPAEQGGFSNEINDVINRMASDLATGDDAKAAKLGGKSGQSWLMAIASALGKKLDKMSNELSSMADQVTDKNPSMTTKFGAKSQEFSMLMNSATNAIKTIGEGLANSARKG